MNNQSDTPRTDEPLNVLLNMIHESQHLAAIDACIAIQKVERELASARAEIEQLREANTIISGRESEWIAKAHYDLNCVKEQRDRLAEAIKEEMEWAKEQSHLCDKESRLRETKEDELGSRYYDGLSVAYYQTMRRLQYITTNRKNQ